MFLHEYVDGHILITLWVHIFKFTHQFLLKAQHLRQVSDVLDVDMLLMKRHYRKMFLNYSLYLPPCSVKVKLNSNNDCC